MESRRRTAPPRGRRIDLGGDLVTALASRLARFVHLERPGSGGPSWLGGERRAGERRAESDRRGSAPASDRRWAADQRWCSERRSGLDRRAD